VLLTQSGHDITSGRPFHSISLSQYDAPS
jgi:hypothetical protein